MNIDQVFALGNISVLFGWLGLIFLPNWKGSQILAAFLIPFLLALAYAGLLFIGLSPDSGSHFSFSAFSSLEGIRQLFESDVALTAGWLHYLAFDLFVGAWEVRDAQRLNIPHMLVLPCLLLTLLFGPLGLGLYLLIRMFYIRFVFL